MAVCSLRKDNSGSRGLRKNLYLSMTTGYPGPLRPFQVLERTKIPYVAYFSFGEKLPVVTHGTSDMEGLGYAYLAAATLIGDEFKDAGRYILRRPIVRDKAKLATCTEVDADGASYGDTRGITGAATHQQLSSRFPRRNHPRPERIAR